MFDLTGKSALVTGASGGIGAAIARALHAQGASVALSGTKVEALEALAAELGDRAFVTPANLSDTAATEGLIKSAEAAMGQVDILVNNAGLTRDGLAMRMKDEDWQLVLDVNLTAGFRLSRAVLRGMMKRRYGRIINISSVVGVMGNPGQCNYVASKAGMIGWSKAMAQEIASRGITVNCIAPGFIATAMTDALNDAQRKVNAILADLPDDADPPSLQKFSLDDLPIMTLSITSDKLNNKDLYDLLDKKIEPIFSRVNGVAQVDLVGGQEREIQVSLDEKKMQGYGLAIADVQQAILSSNLDFPTGALKTRTSRSTIRLSGKYRDVQEMNNLVVSNKNGAQVRLSDIATVFDTQKDVEKIARYNQNSTILMQIKKQSDANAVSVSELVQKTIAQV